MFSLPYQLLIGFLAAIVIAALAFFARSLSISGAIAAALLGTIIFGLGGFSWAIVLLGFFISSSLLSRFRKKRKSKFDEKFSKGSRRDFGQVAANGGIAGLCVVFSLVFPHSTLPWFAFAATLAAVNADTWATELGVLSKRSPRLITTGVIVEPGTSGGISWFGTGAATAGAAFIAILAMVFWPGGFLAHGIGAALVLFLGITLAGLAGSMLDSLLGATVQAIYYCPACQKETERHPLHSCSTPTTLKRGLVWLSNDWVNTLCAVTGALVAIILGLILASSGWFRTISVQEEGRTMSDFPISSMAFKEGEVIPVQFTCSGANVSPALAWMELPAGTQSLALIMDDPDAPIGLFVHWVLYNLPADFAGLPEGFGTSLPAMGTPGKNGYGHSGYDGPCPPPGKPHRYFFTLYATDLAPGLPAGLNAPQLRKQLEGHILGQASIMGTFNR